MCWINWFIREIPLDEWEHLINRMNYAIIHRGPDDQWFFCQNLGNDQILALWQVRLSIIDLSNAGFQPMFYNKKIGWFSTKHQFHFLEKFSKQSISVVFNGEIYNYQEIRAQLIQKWYKFSSNSDTEVLLASYQERWQDCVSKFNGMWAFALYDPAKKELFCSRDRLGKKPFYYYYNNNQFIFSSEIKGILAHDMKKSIDTLGLEYYLAYGYIPAPYSIFENIYKLGHGQNLVFNGQITLQNYWTITTSKPNSLSFEENKIELMKLLTKSVQARLISDVPVGSFLSWWIDSSLISSIAQKQVKNKKLHTFSIGFDIESYNETHFAQIVANTIGSVHHNKILSQEEALNILQKLPHYYDEPFADSSMIPTFAVSQLAKESVSVALSWDWADELFWWYLNFILFYYLKTLKRILLPGMKYFTQKFGEFLSNTLHPAFNNKGLALGLKSLSFLDHPKDHELFAQINGLHVYSTQRTREYFQKYFHDDWRNNSMTAFLNTHLVEDFFVKVDRASMANALEVRSPFADHDLMNFSLTIPAEYKIKIHHWYKYKLKYILKEAGKNYLPNEIYTRRKQWFTLPIAEYFNNERKLFLRGKIEKIMKRDILPISKSYINQLLKEHENWKYDYFNFIYSLLYLELRFEESIDS